MEPMTARAAPGAVRELLADLNLQAPEGEGPEAEVLRLQALMEGARAQLARALAEAGDLGAASESEGEDEEDEAAERAARRADAGAPARGTAREREQAAKRAKNREAARRSRQRKAERVAELRRAARRLQQENLLLLKCLEGVAGRALEGAAHGAGLRRELAVLADDLEAAAAAAPPPPAAEPMAVAAPLAPAPAPSPVPAGRPSPPRPGAGLPSLPSLEEVARAHMAAQPAQLTARATLSARRAAVAEHIAMLSRDNSPRDEEAAAGGGSAEPGAPAGAPAPSAVEQLQRARAVVAPGAGPSAAGRPSAAKAGRFFAPAGAAPPGAGGGAGGLAAALADIQGLFAAAQAQE
jgi:hypothetical protein